MTQFRVILLNDLSFPSPYFSNAAMTYSNRASNYLSAFFLTVRAGTVYWYLFHVAGTDVEMCNLFNSKKTLYDSSTDSRALRAEYCGHSTQYSMQPSNFCFFLYGTSTVASAVNLVRLSQVYHIGRQLLCTTHWP